VNRRNGNRSSHPWNLA